MTENKVMIDLRVLELLASRLCHELVGPVGAVSNGMELLSDQEFGMADDALELATKSAAQAGCVLQYYRMAYGSAGDHQGGDLTLFRSLAEALMTHMKCELQWSDPMPGDEVPKACGKILLNLIVLAEESLPRGGVITTMLARQGDGFEISVGAKGTDAALREQTEAAMSPEVAADSLTARNVHGHFTALLVQRYGGRLACRESEPGHLVFSVVLP